MQTPLAKENDILLFIDGDSAIDWYMVKQTEDVSYDTSLDAVSAGTIGQVTDLEDLEPDVGDLGKNQEMLLAQYRVGVDIGMVYTEMQIGALRKMLWKVKRPVTSKPYVGFFDPMMSSVYKPTQELWMKNGITPGFSVYNPWGFEITPRLRVVGRKLRCFPFDESHKGILNLPNEFNITQRKREILMGDRPARKLTWLGIDKR